MTQLTDKIREAIIGNVGTVISGRIGITDAEILEKKFKPTFEAEDLAKLPNHNSITSVMIQNVPSAPFSMSWIPPMGQSNPHLVDALKKLSAAKYGKPRVVVEKEIADRLSAGETAKKNKLEELRKAQSNRFGVGAGASSKAPVPGVAKSNSGSSFLDEWLAKRQQLTGQPGAVPAVPLPPQQPLSSLPPRPAAQPTPAPAPPTSAAPQPPLPAALPQQPVSAPTTGATPSIPADIPASLTPPPVLPTDTPPTDGVHKFDFRAGSTQESDESQEFSMKIR